MKRFKLGARLAIALAFALMALQFNQVTAQPASPADPIAARKAVMKEHGRDFYGTATRMSRGQIPFDAAAASAAFSRLANNDVFLASFPEGSQTGDTRAAPAIWSNRAQFEMLARKLTTDANAAAENSKRGEEAFKESFRTVAATCDACHREFRLPAR